MYRVPAPKGASWRERWTFRSNDETTAALEFRKRGEADRGNDTPNHGQ